MAAIQPSARPGELDVLQYGVYNLGFIGLSRHPELVPFLRWWEARMVRHCVTDLERGLYLDQRWMDLVPSMFSSVRLYRDPGCNVAYWNLEQRHIEPVGTAYRVNGVPLRFFHFSGFPAPGPDAVSRYPTSVSFDRFPALKPLFEAYRARLAANGYAPTPHPGRGIYLRAAEILDRIGIGRALRRVLGRRAVERARRLFLGRSDRLRFGDSPR